MYNGYETIEGEITYVKYGAVPGKKSKAVQYHIAAKDGNTYGVPVFSGSPEGDKGTILRLYTSKNHSVQDMSGLKFLNPFWGYEIASREDEGDNDDTSSMEIDRDILNFLYKEKSEKVETKQATDSLEDMF